VRCEGYIEFVLVLLSTRYGCATGVLLGACEYMILAFSLYNLDG
jgi:hypothetical protein